jgi:acylphosphatase
MMALATAEELERFEKSIRRGPPTSEVERLEVVTCTLPAESDGFTIER